MQHHPDAVKLFNGGRGIKTCDQIRENERPNHFRGELGTLAGHLHDRKALRAQLEVAPAKFNPESEADLKALAVSAIRGEGWRNHVRESIQQAAENEFLRAGVNLLLLDQDKLIEESIAKLGAIAGRSLNIPEILSDFLSDWNTPEWIRNELGAVSDLENQIIGANRKAVA